MTSNQTAPAKRRINTVRKGRILELDAKKLLNAHGYTVHRTVRTSRFSRRGWISNANDIFGVIDLIAKKAGERTRWIQVTSDTAVGAKFQELRQVPWTVAFDSVELWRWVGGSKQHFHIYRLDHGFQYEAGAVLHLGGGK